MKKYAYLAQLEELLEALPAQEREDALNYYEEYFDAAGKENEEATAAALGDPAEVAQKILEGEGIAPETAAAAPAQTPETPAPKLTLHPDADEKAAGTAPQPPAAPEPPPLDEPEACPTTGTPHRRQMQPLWIVFWVVVIAAALIQLGVWLLHIHGGLDAAASSAVASSEATYEDTTAEAVTPDAADEDASGEADAASSAAESTENIAETGNENVNTVTDEGYWYMSADEAVAVSKLAINVEHANIRLDGEAEQFSVTIDGDAELYTQKFTYAADGSRVFSLTGGDTGRENKTRIQINLPAGAQISEIDLAAVDGAVSMGGALYVNCLNVQGNGISADEIHADTLRMECGSANMTAKLLDAPDITLLAPSSKITVELLPGSQSEYLLDASGGTGKVKLNGKEIGQAVTSGSPDGKSLVVKAGSGCVLNFERDKSQAQGDTAY